MRFWLAAFVVLFAAMELFEWITQLGSWQPSGIWLILGGMGLAVLSNAAHLPKAADGVVEIETPAKTKAETKAVADADSAVIEVSAEQKRPVESIADKSTKDSISFKVRPLKR